MQPVEGRGNGGAEEFDREPHRNRYAAMLSRNMHMTYHFGQAILAKPRDPQAEG